MRLMRRSPLMLMVVGALSCGSDPTLTGEDPITGGGSDAGSMSNIGNPNNPNNPNNPIYVDSDGGTTPGNMPNGGECERKTTSAGPVTPDMMIVLDRSGSMQPGAVTNFNCTIPGIDILCAFAGIDCKDPAFAMTPQCGGSTTLDRWNPAVKGLKSITAQFQDKVSFGLTTFPGDGQRNNQNGCVAGTVKVPVGINTGGAIAMALDNTKPNGNTPTAPTLQAVLQQIQMKKGTLDGASVPPQYVLLVTDGQPTCPGNASQAKSETIKAIQALNAAGVKTYVIGYDASVDPNLANSLKEFAAAGGTGNFFPVQDEASLVNTFKEITGVVASCSYKLQSKPADPTYVKVTIDKEQVYLDKGFKLDGQNVIIEGEACEKLRDGNTHILDVSVECTKQVLY